MLSFFRRLIYSRVGVIVTLGILIVIALAFAAGDITGLRGNAGGSLTGGEVAQVGDAKLGEAELRSRARIALDAVRQQQPTADMTAFVAQGGLQAVLDRTINGLALERFGNGIGLAISRKAVDGEIASIPAFQGLDGKFSQQKYEQLLQQQRLTDRQVREDIVRDTISRQLLTPTIGATQVPAQLALPYASLLLERRRGTVGYIPVSAIGDGAAPADAELATYYNRQRARYTLGERRVARYATVRLPELVAATRVGDAEIAQAYRSQAARYAATEKRSVTQVVIADQGAAATFQAKLRGGTSIAEAARAIGLEPTTFKDVDQAALAAQTSPALATAAFGAAKGAVIGPLRSPLGWSVLRVDAVEAVAARPLAAVRDELAAELAKASAAEALAKVHDDIDDGIGESATFDEIVADAKLKPQATAPLLAGGIDPGQPAARPDPVTARIAAAAFAAEPGDAPQLVQIDADGSFAVVGVGAVAPAAPRPLAQIREKVTRDFVIDRALRTARAAAAAAVARVDKGVPFARALAETKLKLPATKSIDVSRSELAAQRAQLPPAVALMFSMAPRRAKLLEAPNREGWYVVYLDAIQNGNAAGNAALLAQTRQGLGGVIGREFVEQMTRAIRDQIGVRRNEAAIAKVRGELSGGATSEP